MAALNTTDSLSKRQKINEHIERTKRGRRMARKFDRTSKCLGFTVPSPKLNSKKVLN